MATDGQKSIDCTHPAFEGTEYTVLSEEPFTYVRVGFCVGQEWVPTLSNLYSNGKWERCHISAGVTTILTGWPEGETKPEGGTVEIQGTDNGIVSVGGTVTLKAQISDPDQFEFLGWYDSEDRLVSDQAVYSFKAEKSTRLTAKFLWTEIQYSVAVGANPATGGTVTASADKVKYGNTVTVSMTENEGYHFSGWFIGNDKVSDDPTYTYTVKSNITLTAHFDYSYAVEMKGIAMAQEAWKVSSQGEPVAGEGEIQDLLLFRIEGDEEHNQAAQLIYRADGYFTDVAIGALVADNGWGGSVSFEYSQNGKIWQRLAVEDTRMVVHNPNWGPSAFHRYTYSFTEKETVRYIRINFNVREEGFAFKYLPALEYFKYNYVAKEFDDDVVTNDIVYDCAAGTMDYVETNMREEPVAAQNYDWIGCQAALKPNGELVDAKTDGYVIFEVDYLMDFLAHFVYDTSDGHEGGNLDAKIYGCATNSENPEDWTEIPCTSVDTKTAVMWYNRYYMPVAGQNLSGYKFIKVVLNHETNIWAYLPDFSFTYAVPELKPLPAFAEPKDKEKKLLDTMENGDLLEEEFQVSRMTKTYVPNLTDNILRKNDNFAEAYLIYKLDQAVTQIDVRGYMYPGEDYPDGLSMIVRVSADGEKWTELTDFDLRTADIYQGPVNYSQLFTTIPAGMTYVKVEFPDLEALDDLVLSDIQILSTSDKGPVNSDTGNQGQSSKPEDGNSVNTGVPAPAGAAVLVLTAAGVVFMTRRRRDQ